LQTGGLIVVHFVVNEVVVDEKTVVVDMIATVVDEKNEVVDMIVGVVDVYVGIVGVYVRVVDVYLVVVCVDNCCLDSDIAILINAHSTYIHSYLFVHYS
jgi:hypothetical protein